VSNYPWLCLRWPFGFLQRQVVQVRGFSGKMPRFPNGGSRREERGQVAQSVEQRTDNMPIKDWPIAEKANLTTGGQVKRSGRN
jgi:hypothetical protein